MARKPSPSIALGRRTKTIADQFQIDHSAREATLQRARLWARLSIPSLFPLEEYDTWNPDEFDLAENFQSLLARGSQNMASNLTMAIWMPGSRAFENVPNVGVLESKALSDEAKQDLLQRLHVRDVVMMSALEAGLKRKSPRPSNHSRFRTTKYQTYLGSLVTGEALARLNDDFRWSKYRREQYVTDRDDCGDVNYHIIREMKDLAFMDDKRLRDHFGFTIAEAMEMDDHERNKPMFTRVRWHPGVKKWVIEQEVEGKVINTTEERVTPYICTPWSLTPGEDYGRGMIEMNAGDALSFDSLRRSIKEMAALAAKMLWAIDGTSDVQDRDLEKPTGSVIVGARVSGGQVQDVGMLKVDKLADFSIAFQTSEIIRKDLAAAMLIESEVQPQQDRVTRFQAERIAAELDKASFGVSTSFGDDDVEPTVMRTDFQLVRDRIIAPLPKEATQMRTLTGAVQIANGARRQKLLSIAQNAPLLGEEAMRRLDMGVLFEVLARLDNIDEPGLIKSKDDMAKETNAAIRAQLAAEAGKQAISTAGTIAETQAKAAAMPVA